MTHSLHRYGNENDLRKDYVILAMPSKGINDAGSAPKIKKHFAAIKKHNPVNMGGLRIGTLMFLTPDEIIERVTDGTSTYNGVFTDRETVRDVLREVLDQGVGLSTIISGNYEDAKWVAEQLGLTPHTVNRSLGIWGKKDLLPGPDVLEILTMCGHGMISRHFITHCMRRVAAGEDAKKVALEIGRLCYCAICNVARVEDILRRSAAR